MDLVNHVAHARAIDRYERGYFQKYIARLARESGEMSLRDPPGLDNKQYWTERVMNEQLSNFNQIVGVVAGTQLANHYLGHYKKYAGRLTDAQGRPVLLNNLLTPFEFETAVKAGVQNALDCGFGVEGIKALFECIEKMPQRPAWTAYFLPEKMKITRLKKDIEKMEKAFFSQ